MSLTTVHTTDNCGGSRPGLVFRVQIFLFPPSTRKSTSVFMFLQQTLTVNTAVIISVLYSTKDSDTWHGVIEAYKLKTLTVTLKGPLNVFILQASYNKLYGM